MKLDFTIREKGIFRFLIVMFVANFLWKLSIQGDEFHKEVLLFGLWDIQAFFRPAILSTAKLASMLLNLFGVDCVLGESGRIYFLNHYAIEVVWGCTAIKQSFIFVCIMLFAYGRFTPKVLYTLICLILIFFINVFRIAIVGGISQAYPELFPLLHGELFKYLFYFILFLLWLYWNERIEKC